MIKLDPHEEATSGRKYQDPADLHNAVFNTNGYWHEDEPEPPYIELVAGLALAGVLAVGVALLVVARMFE